MGRVFFFEGMNVKPNNPCMCSPSWPRRSPTCPPRPTISGWPSTPRRGRPCATPTRPATAREFGLFCSSFTTIQCVGFAICLGLQKNEKNSWCTRCIYLLRRYDDWHDGTPYQVLDPSWITVKKSHVRPKILNLSSVSNSAHTPTEGKLCHQIPLFQPGLRVLAAVEKHSMHNTCGRTPSS